VRIWPVGKDQLCDNRLVYERRDKILIRNTLQESFVHLSTTILSRLSYTKILKIEKSFGSSNAFAAGARPLTPLEELMTLPQSSWSAGEGVPPPHSPLPERPERRLSLPRY